MSKKMPPVHAGPSAPQDALPSPTKGPRAPVLTAVIIVAILLAIAGGWFAYSSLTKSDVPEPDRAELAAIDAHLTAIQDQIRPIASALASQTATTTPGVIDVSAYRADVIRVRDLVDSTNDLAATSSEALEIRDLVLTGGSQVVTGMQETLDALGADNAEAITAAAVHVEEGLGNLQTARRRLDVLLGRIAVS